MTMKARVLNDSKGNINIHLEGGMDYDNIIPLREELRRLASSYPAAFINLDFTALDFVGTSGIGILVETIRSMNHKTDQIRISNVGPEFMKVFKLYNFNALELLMDSFESEETELDMFYGQKRRTFQN